MLCGDDSGLYFEALDYFPGVHSRRWIGESNDDDLRNSKIIELLNGKNREAYLISEFAVSDPTGRIIARERVKNKFYVADKPYGEHGFGYDKILRPSEEMIHHFVAFVVRRVGYNLFNTNGQNWKDNLESMTIAEMTQAQKNAICDRGRIAPSIKRQLEENEKF